MMRLRDKRVKTYDKRKRLLPLKIMPCLDRILKTPLSREKGKKAIVSLSLNNKSDAGIRCELSLSRLVFFLSRFSHHASHLITIAFRYTKENMLNIKRKKVDFLNSLSSILKGFLSLSLLSFHGSSQFNLFAYIFHSISQARHDTFYYMNELHL